MKKLLCLLLSLMLCVGMLAACATDDAQEGNDLPDTDTTPDQTENGEDPVEESTWLDKIEDRDMGGMEIVFAYFEKNDGKDGCSIEAEEQNGDMINDAMYNRNTSVEERFSVDLIGNKVSTAGGIATTVTPVLTSGSTDPIR